MDGRDGSVETKGGESRVLGMVLVEFEGGLGVAKGGEEEEGGDDDEEGVEGGVGTHSAHAHAQLGG